MRRFLLAMRKFLLKSGYIIILVFGLIFLFLPLRFLRWVGRIEEINLGDPDVWETGGNLFVTNHPSWLDHFMMVSLRLAYFGASFFPYIVTAEDSIKKIFHLGVLKWFSVLVSVNRRGNRHVLWEDVERMESILVRGDNLMMAGAPGRDFKEEEEIIFSPKRHKPLRRFTNLSGRLSTLPGVKTTVTCIEGTDKLYKEVMIGGEKETRFSYWNFFVLFLIRGKIKIRIIYSKKLILEGKKKRLVIGGERRIEATEIIQGTALELLDYPA